MFEDRPETALSLRQIEVRTRQEIRAPLDMLSDLAQAIGRQPGGGEFQGQGKAFHFATDPLHRPGRLLLPGEPFPGAAGALDEEVDGSVAGSGQIHFLLRVGQPFHLEVPFAQEWKP